MCVIVSGVIKLAPQALLPQAVDPGLCSLGCAPPDSTPQAVLPKAVLPRLCSPGCALSCCAPPGSALSGCAPQTLLLRLCSPGCAPPGCAPQGCGPLGPAPQAVFPKAMVSQAVLHKAVVPGPASQALFPQAVLPQATQFDVLLALHLGKPIFHFLQEQKLVTSPSQPGTGEPGGSPGGAGRPSVCCCYPRWILSRVRDSRPGPCDFGAGGSKALSGKFEARPPMKADGLHWEAGFCRLLQEHQPRWIHAHSVEVWYGGLCHAGETAVGK